MLSLVSFSVVAVAVRVFGPIAPGWLWSYLAVAVCSSLRLLLTPVLRIDGLLKVACERRGP